jgi:hypothetical protein
MAVSDPHDDGASIPETGTTDRGCPACGGRLLNGQGLYTCFDCAWSLGPAESTFDHPALHC